MNAKNLKKGVAYTIRAKNKQPITAFFNKVESVKYLRFTNSSGTPILVKKNSKFSPMRRNNRNSNNKTRRVKRVEFEPTPVRNW